MLRSQLQGGAELQRYAAEMGVPELFLIEADYRRGQIEAEIEFVDKLAASIADGSLDGVDYWRQSTGSTRPGEEVTPFRLPAEELSPGRRCGKHPGRTGYPAINHHRSDAGREAAPSR